MDNIPSSLYGTVWVGVFVAWQPFSYESNYAYLQELINSAKLKGKDLGVVGGLWTVLFGDRYACRAAASQPLMYWGSK
jgi:hypothetical protein